MVKKEKTTKKSKETEQVYIVSSDEEPTYEEKTNTKIFIPQAGQFTLEEESVYLEDFNKALQKIKALKELHLDEINNEKPTQQIVDALTEKISELIKKLE